MTKSPFFFLFSFSFPATWDVVGLDSIESIWGLDWFEKE